MKRNFALVVFSITLFLRIDIKAQRAEFIPIHQKSRFYIELKESSADWIEGFHRKILGTEIDYFSALPHANHALITRASDGKMSIEWETAKVQKIASNSSVIFVWLAGINCNTNEQPYDLELNGKNILTFSTRYSEEWVQTGLENTELKFSALHQDVNGDLHGYMFLKVPENNLKNNKSVNIKITGQAKNTNNWMMVFTYPNAVSDFRKAAENGFWHKLTLNEKKDQQIIVEFPNSWIDKNIKVEDQSGLIGLGLLSKKNDCRLSFKNDSEKLNFPLQIFANKTIIDEIPTFSDSDDSYSSEMDGSVIYRNWKTGAESRIIESSKNDFLQIPEDKLPWPEYVMEFPSLALGKNNELWMAVTERLGYDTFVSVYEVKNNRQEKICMLNSGNQKGIAAPAIFSYANDCVVFFPVEKENKWDIAYSFIDKNNLSNPKISFINCDGTSNISPSAVVLGKDIFVVWESNAGKARGIYSCKISKNSSGIIERISSPDYNNYNPAIVSLKDGNLFVVWDSYRNNNADIWGAKFVNGTWQNEFQITSDPRIERHPSLALNGSDVWMTWQAQSYGNAPSRHNHLKNIELNHVEEQRIVVAQLDGLKLNSPINLFNKISPDNSILLRPKISFTPNGILILTARESINQHDGWRGILWNYAENNWSEKIILHNFRGRWHPVNVVCSADSIFTAVQYDSRPKSGTVNGDSDKDWKSAVSINSIGYVSSSNPVSLITEKLIMPHTHFSLTEKSTLVSATFPRKEIIHKNKKLKLYFGDFHEHTDISICARNMNPPGHDLFANLRDIEKLDFCALTDHHAGIDRPIWSLNSEQTRNNHDPGRFVTFLGQEWSSSTGSKSFGYGHHNFIYLDPFMKTFITSKESYLKPNELWNKMNAIDFFSIPHQLADWTGLVNSRGAWGNPPKDWNYFNEEFQPVAEIFQGRGSYEYYGCPRQAKEGAPFSMYYLQDAWKRGIIIGVIASPDHGGGFGKVGVWAEELTRESIFSAVQKRHTFGTSGAKMELLFRSGSALMGDKVMSDPDTLHFQVKAESLTKIKELIIFRNNKIILKQEPNKKDINLEWIDSKPLKNNFTWYYVRLHTIDDELAWSSPIWFINIKE